MTKKNTPEERCACGHNESQHFDWKRGDGTPFGCVEGRGGLSVCDCKKFTPPAPPEERNQCDGCRRGMEKNDRNIHHDGEGRPYMVCTAARYPAPLADGVTDKTSTLQTVKPLADGGEILTREEFRDYARRLTYNDEPYRDTLIAHDAALRAEVERLTLKLKCYEPVNTYNGLDIDAWKARAEKLAAALREIVDQTERGYCAEPCSTHIARSALAEIDNNEGGKK